MKLHKHSERDGVGVLPLQSYFGPIREESVIRAEVLFTYFLREHHLAFQLGDHFTKLFMFMFPDSCIAKDSVLKVIAQDYWKIISAAVRETNYFSLQLMRQMILLLHNKLLLCFDNTQGHVRCVIFALESVERETAELLFKAIGKHFQESTTPHFDNLVGLGTDGANVK